MRSWHRFITVLLTGSLIANPAFAVLSIPVPESTSIVFASDSFHREALQSVALAYAPILRFKMKAPTLVVALRQVARRTIYRMKSEESLERLIRQIYHDVLPAQRIHPHLLTSSVGILKRGVVSPAHIREDFIRLVHREKFILPHRSSEISEEQQKQLIYAQDLVATFLESQGLPYRVPEIVFVNPYLWRTLFGASQSADFALDGKYLIPADTTGDILKVLLVTAGIVYNSHGVESTAIDTGLTYHLAIRLILERERPSATPHDVLAYFFSLPRAENGWGLNALVELVTANNLIDILGETPLYLLYLNGSRDLIDEIIGSDVWGSIVRLENRYRTRQGDLSDVYVGVVSRRAYRALRTLVIFITLGTGFLDFLSEKHPKQGLLSAA